LVKRNVGNKTQPPLVDTNQRNPVLRQLAANAQHGAVATHHQAQVAMGANAGDIHGGVVAQADIGRGFHLQHHLATPVHQEVGHFVQVLARGGTRDTGAGGLVFADKCYVSEFGLHSQITTLNTSLEWPNAG
jgi:hypothetical protein